MTDGAHFDARCLDATWDLTPARAGLDGGAPRAVAPSDTEDLPDGACAYLYVSQGGEVAALDELGRPVRWRSGDAQYHWFRLRRILSTGTTATGILAVY